jgi:hypothetical protein
MRHIISNFQKNPALLLGALRKKGCWQEQNGHTTKGMQSLRRHVQATDYLGLILFKWSDAAVLLSALRGRPKAV